MDKNTLTGLVVIGAILLGFTWYGNNQQEKINKELARKDSIEQVELNKKRALEVKPEAEIGEAVVDSAMVNARVERMRNILGSELYEAKQGIESEYILENDKIVVGISNKGAIVNSVMLKDYKTWDGQPLYLFNKESAKFDLSYRTTIDINTSDYFFTAVNSAKKVVASTAKESISFRLYNDSLSYVEYVYSIKPGDYEIGLQVNFVDMDYLLDSNNDNFKISWSSDALQSEKGYSYENQYTTLAYAISPKDKVEELSIAESKSENAEGIVGWIAFKQQFFSSIFVSEDNTFENGEFSYTKFPEGSGKLKHFEASVNVPFKKSETAYDFLFYYGPNDYNIMKGYDRNFQDLLPLGWGIFGWINKLIVIPTFDLLSKAIGNFGWIILFLTIIIKLIIFPFTYKSYVSMAKMRIIKPEVDALAEKYPNKDQAMQKQQAMMDLYRRAGVNPMGGCVPMLFQMPILIAMFRFFPASIELRGEHFLWATDLSSYDSVLNLPFSIPFYGDHVSLFALLMGVSTFFASKINMAQSGASTSQEQMPGMKFMTLYLMPVMLVVWFNNYSSGLSYYYLLSNIITLGQTFIIRRFVDDKTLHEQMKQNAKKPRKKSKWQQRYEEMAKMQQQQQGGR